MTTQIGSGKTQGLIEFLDQLVEKGRATSGSITPLKTSVRQVVTIVDGEEKWEEVDVRSIDVNDYMARFKNLTMGKYSTDSYKAYQSRLTKAIEWYGNFLTDPGWAPPKSLSGKNKPIAGKAEGGKKTSKLDTLRNEAEYSTEIKKPSAQSDLIAYPFPLLTGKIVNLYLPIDLKSSDARRIGRFVESLCVDNDELK